MEYTGPRLHEPRKTTGNPAADVVPDLVAMGAKASRDRLLLAQTTYQSMKSHIALLKRNNVDLSEENLTKNTFLILEQLVTMRGDRLTDGYKRQVGNTLRRIYPHAKLSMAQYSRSRKRQAATRVMNDNYVNGAMLICQYAAAVINYVSSSPNVEVNLAIYDTSVACMLTLATSLRIGELAQLTTKHIPLIQAGQPINLRCKKSTHTRTLVQTDVLNLILQCVLQQRPFVAKQLSRKTLDIRNRQEKRFGEHYVLTSSASYMTKTLREMASIVGFRTPTVGFNSFRKLTVSVLVANGGHLVAQALNNHSSLNTTIDHYAVNSMQSTESAFARLAKLGKAPPGAADGQGPQPTTPSSSLHNPVLTAMGFGTGKPGKVTGQHILDALVHHYQTSRVPTDNPEPEPTSGDHKEAGKADLKTALKKPPGVGGSGGDGGGGGGAIRVRTPHDIMTMMTQPDDDDPQQGPSAPAPPRDMMMMMQTDDDDSSTSV